MTSSREIQRHNKQNNDQSMFKCEKLLTNEQAISRDVNKDSRLKDKDKDQGLELRTEIKNFWLSRHLSRNKHE